jgi:hypothetical protein
MSPSFKEEFRVIAHVLARSDKMKAAFTPAASRRVVRGNFFQRETESLFWSAVAA